MRRSAPSVASTSRRKRAATRERCARLRSRQGSRVSTRILRRSPGFTAAAVLSLALGIGANTAIFSVVNAILLRPLPYADSSRLTMLWTDDPAHGIAEEGVSYPNFDDWRTMSRSFVDMAISSRRNPVTLTGELDPIRVEAALVSPNLFAVLGVAPAVGRVFAADELERRERSLVISHGLWTRRFGASLAALGQSLEVNGASWRIVGVMPRTFQFPSAEIALWMPLTSHPRWAEVARERFSDFGLVIGRLRARVTLPDARAEIRRSESDSRRRIHRQGLTPRTLQGTV